MKPLLCPSPLRSPTQAPPLHRALDDTGVTFPRQMRLISANSLSLWLNFLNRSLWRWNGGPFTDAVDGAGGILDTFSRRSKIITGQMLNVETPTLIAGEEEPC